MTNTDKKELSIQVSLSGLSFCILNQSTNTIEYLASHQFAQKASPSGMLAALIKELSAHSTFASTNFSSVIVVHQNELSTLVPEELYVESKNADYLKFNNKMLKTDFISTDALSAINSINVYVPYVNVNNYIFDTFGPFIYKHSSTILIDAFMHQKDENKNSVFVNISAQTLEIIVMNENKLELYNSFEYFSVEDLIYYVLFVFEQLQLDPDIDPIKLTGNISENDERYTILYKYIRHIEFLQPQIKYKLSDAIDHKTLHQYFIITKSY
ncbi:MAG: DUF3822 family protein [Winogradskyella sp.]|nr:DUF3822 family protein [Winogradskyella sp.]NNK39795.1 DUF3822 family protein [Winogradskyella sp.]